MFCVSDEVVDVSLTGSDDATRALPESRRAAIAAFVTQCDHFVIQDGDCESEKGINFIKNN